MYICIVILHEYLIRILHQLIHQDERVQQSTWLTGFVYIYFSFLFKFNLLLACQVASKMHYFCRNSLKGTC
jgi:hypothetical protein